MPERIQDILRRYQGKGQWDIYISAPEINRLIVLDEKREAEIARLRTLGSSLLDALEEFLGGVAILDEGRRMWHYPGLIEEPDIRRLQGVYGEGVEELR